MNLHLRASALISCFVVSAGLAEAQVRENWRGVFDFGTPYSNDTATTIAAHTAGGYVVGGATRSDPSSSVQTNPLVLRYDAAGNVSWSRSFTGDPKGDFSLAIGVAPSGAIYSASCSGAFSGADVRVVKYDAAGTQQWVAGPYGGATTDELVSARQVLFDASENVYVGCSILGGAAPSYDMVLLSYDVTGAFRFATAVNGPGNGADSLKAVCRTSGGDVYLVGSMDGNGGALSLLGAAKLDSSGALQWTRVHDHSGATTTQLLYGAACDAAGNLYVCGAAGSAPASFAAVVGSWDPSGNERFFHQIPGVGNAIATQIALDPWGNVLVISNLGNTAMLSKYTGTGTFVWQQSHVVPGAAGSVPSDLVVGASGDPTVLGVSTASGSPVQDLFVLQYTPAGALRWSRSVDNLGQSESAGQLHVGPDGRVALAGTTRTYSLGSGFGPNDVLTVELGDQSQPFCFGDGSGAACPCGNTSAAGAQQGCLNSLGLGAALTDSGDASVSNDTLVLTATDIPGPGLFFQGSARMAGGAGIAFGDGLLCAGGTITRLGIVFPTGTTASYPGGLNPNPIHVGGMATSGDVRHYQTWYRDAAVHCQSETYDLTGGLTITWAP